MNEPHETLVFEARCREIGRRLALAIEAAAEALAELGSTGDEAGEFIQNTWDCSDWADYFEANDGERIGTKADSVGLPDSEVPA